MNNRIFVQDKGHDLKISTKLFMRVYSKKKLELKYSSGIQNDVYLFTDAYRLKQAFPGEIKSLIIRVLRICEMNNNTKNYSNYPKTSLERKILLALYFFQFFLF
ncbi:MAG: hypothetical protein ACLFNL_09500, partial [Bacteroidales bacterium]